MASPTKAYAYVDREPGNRETLCSWLGRWVSRRGGIMDLNWTASLRHGSLQPLENSTLCPRPALRSRFRGSMREVSVRGILSLVCVAMTAAPALAGLNYDH